MDVELASHSDNPIVTGLEWMVEEGREVTNFAENNFAAVGAPTSSMWLSNSPWCLVWDAYCNVLTTRPVATKLATGMVGTFLGDLVAQFLQGVMQTHQKVTTKGGSKSSKAVASAAADAFALDFSRTARLVGFSAIVGTPVAFVWFSLLDQVGCCRWCMVNLLLISGVGPALHSVYMACSEGIGADSTCRNDPGT
eukprot:GHUV01051485.1.p1 GENE.GHUV01051485.1~~GHUV01051485.1.p1  ORF type:complete len:195 (-),score=49.92 GHUV01051485.1:104-688(-)